MANAKLSALTSAAFAGGDLIYLVQGGNSRVATLGAMGAALLDDTGETQALTTLGGGTTGIAVFRAATQSAALTQLGVTAFAKTILDDTGATTARATIGANNASNLTTGAVDTGLLPTTISSTRTFSAGVILPEATAPTTIADQGALYTKNDGTQTELYFREESDGDEVQITKGGFVNAGWEDLGETSVSAASALTKGSLGDYKIIQIIGRIALGTDNQQILLQTSTDGGSNYAESSGDYHVQATRSTSTTVDGVGNTTSAGMLLAATGVGNASQEWAAFNITLVDFNQSDHCRMTGTANTENAGGALFTENLASTRVDTTARDALRIKAVSGNITGYIRVMGMR